MHFLVAVIALILLIPAAVAGIGSGLLDAAANIDCLAAALPHASALLAEMAPLGPAMGLLLAGVAALGIAAWLIARAINGT